MEKAVLKTLVYSNIFDYPLKAWEVHKWLIFKKANLKEVERSLDKLIKKGKIEFKEDFYFLKGRKALVELRIERERNSTKYFYQTILLSNILKIIPWIKLVGITGSLSMNNAKKQDDIDLIIIIQKNRLFLTRLLCLLTLELLGKRRKRGENIKTTEGKFCLNILLEEDKLTQSKRDIYIAHEVLQLKPLWSRDNIYQKFLEDNLWAFKNLPNWFSNTQGSLAKRKIETKTNSFLNFIEILAREYQLKHMGKIKGDEKISNSMLYFHPVDKRVQILKIFNSKIKSLS